MAATNLLKPPAVAPGQDMTEMVHRASYWAKSPSITYASTTPAELFSVPANTMIVDLVAHKSVAMDASTSADVVITLGDSDDVDRFMAGSDFDGANVGFRSMKMAESSNQVGQGGHVYTSAGLITATLAVDDSSNGTFVVYCQYVPYSDEL
ncbi:MAG: hypothetical protein KJ556_20575 [Gammaproteobacteria bacterium]|nr:hypothetical protein [Gammaproteobacteria bacterium]